MVERKQGLGLRPTWRRYSWNPRGQGWPSLSSPVLMVAAASVYGAFILPQTVPSPPVCSLSPRGWDPLGLHVTIVETKSRGGHHQQGVSLDLSPCLLTAATCSAPHSRSWADPDTGRTEAAGAGVSSHSVTACGFPGLGCHLYQQSRP